MRTDDVVARGAGPPVALSGEKSGGISAGGVDGTVDDSTIAPSLVAGGGGGGGREGDRAVPPAGAAPRPCRPTRDDSNATAGKGGSAMPIVGHASSGEEVRRPTTTSVAPRLGSILRGSRSMFPGCERGRDGPSRRGRTVRGNAGGGGEGGRGGRRTGGNSSSSSSSIARFANADVDDVRRLFVRYSIGDYVLISREICDDVDDANVGVGWVNRFGYPPRLSSSSGGGGGGGGGVGGGHGSSSSTHAAAVGASCANAPEEQRGGPYAYVLAVIVSVHFGEDSRYYTVRREDTSTNQRADANYMEPITTSSGLDAARYVASRRRRSFSNTSGRLLLGGIGRGGGARGRWWWRWRCGERDCGGAGGGRLIDADVFGRVGRWTGVARSKLRTQMEKFLNGNRPYGISCRFTGVNALVICGIWYLYIDQVRLVFMPPSADYPCAVVSAIVWIVLVMELIVEYFIRPSGYRALIRSEKAYLPSTVRYLSTFHLITELISLVFFAPEFLILFGYDDPAFSLSNACLMSIYGPGRLEAFYGTAFICMLRLRIFGVVRHWTKMWINNTFVRVRGNNGEVQVQRAKGFFAPQRRREAGNGQEIVVATGDAIFHSINDDDRHKRNIAGKKDVFANDYHLTNASRIGSALSSTNATRVLIFVFLIGLLPLYSVFFRPYGGTNHDNYNSAVLLNANNLAFNATDNETCLLLEETVKDWLQTHAFEKSKVGQRDFMHLWCLDIQPRRCEFQSETMRDCTVLDTTGVASRMYCSDDCNNETGLCSKKNCEMYRTSTFLFVSEDQPGIYSLPNGEPESANFAVNVVYNEIASAQLTMIYVLILNLVMTFGVLLFLSILRNDAGRLVLGPLRRMLKIVAFYAKNPLSPPPTRESVNSSFLKLNDAYFYDSDDEKSIDQKLGSFETEQLVNTVTKITELLRKCWGVAGAGIISSNLATNEGGLTAYFNPTVPGKAVYALFSFVYIDRFNFHLHALKGDIMILINDIAAVLHEEVYRWGYEDSGQCNKNLGNAFLMVYKIGAVSEVMEKRERAEAVIFSTKDTVKSRRRKTESIYRRSRSGSEAPGTRIQASHDRPSQALVDSIDLSSLPGMRAFSDRALLGLLKTFAGIHRDKTILSWNNDFRLGAGVGAMSINLLFGMDAGWAVEGAVGSMYKIDATYLSPHVNMASRMTSATKQYGVYFLLSQAVQKLLSENAQSKLRHVDTVTVKGSSVQQKIFTYDARVRSDFFLYSKTKSQEDADSDRYTPAIWNVDQDLVAMRSHICDEFMEMFNRGRDEYLSGNWPTAIKCLRLANRIMVEEVVSEGFSNSKSLIGLQDDTEVEGKHLGDGPCQRLIAYMEELGGEAPKGWAGYRPLTSK